MLVKNDCYKLELYWNDIPTDPKKAVTYPVLMYKWGVSERIVRSILHELSIFDNGDNYILIRSGKNKGFYKTDDMKRITAYKSECLSKGRSVLAPVKKINRVMQNSSAQYQFENNLRLYREAKGLTQLEVCNRLNKYDNAFNVAMISKFENGVCLPTPYMLLLLAQLYDCEPSKLLNPNFIL